MNFTTKGVSENSEDGKYIRPGVHEVTITNVTSREAEGTSAPSIFVEFQKNGTEQKLNVQFAFSDKGVKFALMKLKHLLTKVADEKTVDAIVAKNVGELAKAYSKLLLNKTLRVKFNGKEIAGTQGKKNWFKAELGIPRTTNPFAETIDTNPSTLSFDAKRDIKYLSAATSTPAVVPVSNDDLPF